MTRPSIAFVAPQAYPVLAGSRDVRFVGGAEVQQVEIATELARRGYRVSMVSHDYGQTEGESIRGVRLVKMCAPGAGLPGVRFVHPRLSSLWAALRRADADVYYQRSSGAVTGFVAAFARWRGAASIFAGAHDADFDPALPLIRYARDRTIYRWGLRNVDRIVVQTERQQRRCREVFSREAERIDSGYSHRGVEARHDGIVLWVATVKPMKQPERFVELAARLPAYRFRLVGGPGAAVAEQDCWRRVEAAAARTPNLELTGFVPFADVERHFDGASVFVNTSAGEGFPNTFLQAWSRGVPAVSFFDAGAELEGNKVGIVVADVDEMAREVAVLKADAERWRSASTRVRCYFERSHSTATVVDAYERMIVETVAARSVRREAAA